jgi:hypothetical protein
VSLRILEDLVPAVRLVENYSSCRHKIPSGLSVHLLHFKPLLMTKNRTLHYPVVKKNKIKAPGGSL